MPTIRLVCTDVDHTVYGLRDPTERFREFWERLDHPEPPLLCYNSGRLVDDQLELIETSPIPRPDYIIGGVGTAIYDVRQGTHLVAYQELFSHGWDHATVVEVMESVPGIEIQPVRFQTQFKSSWYLHDAPNEQINEIRSKLADRGILATVIYSSSRDLDVIPAKADKGDALSWLCNFLGIALTEVVVAGDTGNDARMFEVPGVRGIVVANAKPELIEATQCLPVYRAKSPEADGVVEGLKYFGITDRT